MTATSVDRTTALHTIVESGPAWQLSGDGDEHRWLRALMRGLRHPCYLLEARQAGACVGQLPLIWMRSWLFGDFLVSLPYLTTAGVTAATDEVAVTLIDRAVHLADQLKVRYLELRHQREVSHPSLSVVNRQKAQMHLPLAPSADALWSCFKSKVRNQIRKSGDYGLNVEWGRDRLLDDFYRVFCRNMRDLGTPPYGRHFFAAILAEFDHAAEICVVRLEQRAIAAALLVHGTDGTTMVPSASSLRAFNYTNANMLMYWHLLQRSSERGQTVFDFGRSTRDSNTYRFKKQWGAMPADTCWQYYLRRGAVDAMRPDGAGNRRLIAMWKRLPVWVTRLIGPEIVRGIP